MLNSKTDALLGLQLAPPELDGERGNLALEDNLRVDPDVTGQDVLRPRDVRQLHRRLLNGRLGHARPAPGSLVHCKTLPGGQFTRRGSSTAGI